MNYVLNGAEGDAAAALLSSNFDPGILRPFVDPGTGKSYVSVQKGADQDGKPVINNMVTNAPATLRKDEWIQFDQAVVRAAKPRLRAWGDLNSAGLTYTIPNGLGKTTLEHETQSDVTGAELSMDGLTRKAGDRPVYTLNSLPLPIVHKDFTFSARQVAVSRNSGTPLDTSSAELAGRRVAEEIEKLLLGVSDSYTFGGGTIFGYTNFTHRNTQTLTNPTSTWTPADTVSEVLTMKNTSQGDFHYGPWTIYSAPNWDTYLDDDYSSAKGDNTLRDRLTAIEGITAVKTADYLTNYDLVMVQMTPDVVRAVNGMAMTTVQWETNGGMQVNFKVMAIMVPQLRADYNNNCGIVHGSV